MKNKNLEKGQGELVSFILLLFFSTIILSLFYYYNLLKVKASNIINEYKNYIDAENLILNLEADFQILSISKNDGKLSQELEFLRNKYINNNIRIEDISSGININYLSKKYLHDSNLLNKLFLSQEAFNEVLKIQEKETWLENINSINKYLTDFGKQNIKFYGWINPSFVDDILKEKSLIRDLPVLNIYYTDPEIIHYFITKPEFKISNYDVKYDKLINEIEINPYLDKQRIQEILSVNKNNPILDIFGVKTQFWNVLLNTEDATISLIIAADLIKENKKSLLKYRIIKREIEYEKIR